MANRIFDQLGGIITVKLKGEKPEKVINMALTRGLYIRDIKKTDNSMEFKVKASAYEALKSICDENGYFLEITDKQGFPFFKGVFKRRLGFLGGALLFVAALYLFSSFIWFIDVSGNKQVEKSRILITASKYGVYEGVARWNFNRLEVEEAILRELDELAYVKLDIQGVKLNIEVVEKIFPRSEINGPCHIVASKDGIVKEVLVLDGQPSVKEGDVVARGNILISGIVFPSLSPFVTEENAVAEKPYMVRARGRVKAQVSYQGYGECRLRTEEMIFTGHKDRKIYIEIPGRKIFVKGKQESGFAFSKQKIEQKSIITPLGRLGICFIHLEEQALKKTEYTELEAEKIARAKAQKSLSSQIAGQQIINSKSEIISSPSDPVLRIKISVDTIEDIATAQPINEGVNGN